MSPVSGPLRVRVPASSANLGPGFDALGLALGLHDELTVEATDDGLVVEVRGEGAGEVPLDDTHLVVRSMEAAFSLLGERPAGVRLTCTNAVPHGRGLGSSAAAIVGGLVAARALVAGEDRLDDLMLLQLATDLEGHPDNVAPALLGGLTIAWVDGAAAAAQRLDCDVPVTVFVPPEPVSTERARGLLPDTVTHADASFNAGRAALLVAALTAAPDRLISATEDRLHQTYRSLAMPDSYALVRRMRVEGVPAIISGAGPTVLAFARGIDDFCPPGWVVHHLDVDPHGAVVLPAS
ncbi:homoserine kinase [Aeromicrobium marinum DSM 15272]|uniref:Homoserine kinase n=1 Tax=Aeromicrobium marinum DSM 15272 TaxID=585531 RepID=E2SCP2_9ACTN|nr:homoserine kinase [Aeromicrobium marinum]EFQ82995.1 homoserine kinase [Aeromicrobium marinum DSM 15272]